MKTNIAQQAMPLVLEALAGETLMEPVIFTRLVTDMGFDPYADVPGFTAWDLPACEPLPPTSVREMIEQITGTEYTAWAASDIAQMLDWLNMQHTREMPTIDGEIVTTGG
jgi:hypothetical protein